MALTAVLVLAVQILLTVALLASAAAFAYAWRKTGRRLFLLVATLIVAPLIASATQGVFLYPATLLTAISAPVVAVGAATAVMDARGAGRREPG